MNWAIIQVKARDDSSLDKGGGHGRGRKQKQDTRQSFETDWMRLNQGNLESDDGTF